jgi:hypothetical protein
MCAAFEIPPPRLDELPISVEDGHRVGAFAGVVHRVVHVDPPLGILAHTVRVAVFEVCR